MLLQSFLIILLDLAFITGQEYICTVINATATRQFKTLDDGKTTVVCDTESDNGGWIMFQRRVNGDIDFHRNWANYTAGFGDFYTNFWLGLTNLNILCNKKKNQMCELRVDFGNSDNSYFAQYIGFFVDSQNEKFRSTLEHFAAGNLEPDALAAGGSPGVFSYTINGARFYTSDKDNSARCAMKNNGGFWYNKCTRANFNGMWGEESELGMFWEYHTSPTDTERLWMTWSEMKVRVPSEVDVSALDTSRISTKAPVYKPKTSTEEDSDGGFRTIHIINFIGWPVLALVVFFGWYTQFYDKSSRSGKINKGSRRQQYQPSESTETESS